METGYYAITAFIWNRGFAVYGVTMQDNTMGLMSGYCNDLNNGYGKSCTSLAYLNSDSVISFYGSTAIYNDVSMTVTICKFNH